MTLDLILIVIFVIFLGLSLWSLVARNESQKIPSVAVSLGVTFTFIGIFIALYGFDVNDIQSSIPALLEGMRLAFSTSIIGMVVAVSYRIAPGLSLWSPKDSDADMEDDGPVASVRTIEALNEAQERRHQREKRQLTAIQTALAGDGDTTLLTQMQKLRTTVSDKHDRLHEAFEQFSEQIVEDQTAALIAALEDVIRDFNTKINEQFGENFKRLNEAVGRLLTWQQEYKQQVEVMTERLNAAVSSMEASEQALKRISNHSERFGESADQLEEMIVTFNHEINALEQHLESFAELSETATQAFPELEDGLNELTSTYEEGVTRVTEQLEQSARQQRTAVSKVMDEMKNEQERLHATLESTSDEVAENIANQIETLDTELGNELNKALSSLGSQLTSLSEKFVEDYTPLTQELQRLVELSKDAKQRNGR